MTERERLIELLKDADKKWFYFEDKANYLLENGVRILPCKLDDTVYLVLKGTAEVLTGMVNRMSYDYKGDLVIVIRYLKGDWYRSGNFKISSFGKSIFFNIEDAERVLKGR